MISNIRNSVLLTVSLIRDPFAMFFYPYLDEYANWLQTYDYRISAESLFKQPEINELPPVYAAFNREEHKSDVSAIVVHMQQRGFACAHKTRAYLM